MMELYNKEPLDIIPQGIEFKEESWSKIVIGLKQLYKNKISKMMYITLCSLTYNIKIDQAFESNKSHLKLKFWKFFKRHLKKKFENCESIAKKTSSQPYLLQQYVKYWKNYRSASNTLQRILCFRKTNWPNSNDERYLFSLSIVRIALECWAELVLNPLIPQLSYALLDLVRDAFCDEFGDWNIINNYLCSLVEFLADYSNLHYKESDSSEYETHFGIPVLVVNKEFYETQCPLHYDKFMKKIKEWFNIKEENISHDISKYQYASKVFTTIINNMFMCNFYELQLLDTEFSSSLFRCNVNRVRKMFHFYETFYEPSMALKYTQELIIYFEKTVYLESLNMFRKHHETCITEPLSYIAIVLCMHDYYNSFIHSIFDDDESYVLALDRAFVKFIRYSFPINSEVTSKKFAKFSVFYYHTLLNQDSEMQSAEEKMNESVAVLKYIQEKDYFINLYCKMLLKRVISRGDSVSMIKEKTMIEKIREIWGNLMTKKLYNIFNEICISKQVSEKFKKEVKSCEYDLSVFSFKSSSWPLHQHNNDINILLPAFLQQDIERFITFYSVPFTGRKLQWLHSMSLGAVRSNCFDKNYVFTVTAYQMIILLQFNTIDHCTVADLQKTTGLSLYILLSVLESLTKVKLLRTEDQVLASFSMISLALDYKNKRLNLNIIPKEIENA